MDFCHVFGKLEKLRVGLWGTLQTAFWVSLCSVASSGSHPEPGQFYVPHSLALVPHLGLLCVADRENGRIQCFKTDTKEFVREIKHAAFGRNVFAISYIPGI